MDYLQNNFPGNKTIELCQCETEMNNQHLYECKTLNSFEKKVSYNKLFVGRFAELKYSLKILEENKRKFELPQAQNSCSLRH